MKPPVQPPPAVVTLEGLLHALSDPIRLSIFANLFKASCPLTCGTFLACDQGTIPKSTLSQHLGVLRKAGLIVSERKGVEIYNKIRCDDAHRAQWAPVLEPILKAYLAQQGESCSENVQT